MTLAELRDMMADADKSPRINKWEREFMLSIEDRMARQLELTESQQYKLKQIEIKLYSI